MSEFDDDFKARYAAATGKGDIHIPGAGTMGMVILVISLGMLFIASLVAYGLIRFGRFGDHPWPPPGFPPPPASLWLSTVIILISSITMQWALRSAKKDRQKGLVNGLLITQILGWLFMALQVLAWLQFYLRIAPAVQFSGPYLGTFYVLTGLHAAHVLGGLIPMAIVYVRAKRGLYHPNYHPGVRYSTIYWHFLDAVWVVMFVLIYIV